MSALFKKLNLGSQTVIFILNAPASFDAELALLSGPKVLKTLSAKDKAEFALAFASTQAEVDRLSQALIKAGTADATMWMAYPKASSKKFKCEFNRDTGWSKLGEAGFEPVRQVAIDEDWSALRFRRVEFIKKVTRSQSMALSAEGKRRAPKA